MKHFTDGDSVNTLRVKFIWENMDIYLRFISPLAAEIPHGVEIHPKVDTNIATSQSQFMVADALVGGGGGGGNYVKCSLGISGVGVGVKRRWYAGAFI